MGQYQLNNSQSIAIVERIEEHVETTSYDWQLPVDVHNSTIDYWADIIRQLKHDKRADALNLYKLS